MNKLKYYCFDMDDNILHMPTIIHMDKLVEGAWQPVSVSPSEFALVRHDPNYRNRDNNPQKAYEEFRDFGPRKNKAFVSDIIAALERKQFGPSWNKFIKCIVEGSLFSIITARAHQYETIKEGIKYIIDNCLNRSQKEEMYRNCENFLYLFEKRTFERNRVNKFTDNKLICYYLDKCKFYGVGLPMSESFKSEFNLPETTSIEDAKKIALDKFLSICNEYGENSKLNVSIGFSDDDKKNVEHIKKFFEFKSLIYGMKLNVYDTSNKLSIKTKIEKGITEEMGPDLGNRQANLLRFDGFNSLANTLTNSTNDFTGFNNNQKVKIASKLYKNTLNKKTRKAKIKKDVQK